MSYDIEAELGLGVSLLGSEAEPLHGFGLVFRHSIASGVHVTEVELGLGVSLLGSKPNTTSRPLESLGAHHRRFRT